MNKIIAHKYATKPPVDKKLAKVDFLLFLHIIYRKVVVLTYPENPYLWPYFTDKPEKPFKLGLLILTHKALSSQVAKDQFDGVKYLL